MWRNNDALDFVGWLRDHNDALSDQAMKVGFYGLDLYSLFASIEFVFTLRSIVHVCEIRER
jgi:erythromycin esterase-like protein